MLARNVKFLPLISKRSSLNFTTGLALRDPKSGGKESERMKKFRQKLNSEITPEDPLLIEIDPKSGEFVPDSEQNPTKWGDWQIGGRVSDF